MKIFLTGATGYIGSAVAEALLAAGHTIAGLARSAEAVQQIRDRGMTPVQGDLKSPPGLVPQMAAVDGVIHAGTTNEGHADADAVFAMLKALEDTGKPFVYTSGIWVIGNTGDRPADESAAVQAPSIVAWRPAVERTVLDAARQGVRAIVIRPAIVYGRGGGIPAMFIQSAQESGAARYIGDGMNRWPMVHVEDLADLYVRAVDRAPTGTLLHAADGSAVRVKEIAEAASFAADAGGRTESWPIDQAREKLGPLAEALLLDQIVSGDKAKQTLGWSPRAVGILDDLRYGSYAMSRINP
ncbi:MAG: NAD-dependent epimerase/dehydratase family protein [Bryobacteraceae bacterium]